MRTSLLITVLILLLAANAAAQSTALLTATVVDPSGAVIPGAQVECRSVDTGARFTTPTNAARLGDLQAERNLKGILKGEINA